MQSFPVEEVIFVLAVNFKDTAKGNSPWWSVDSVLIKEIGTSIVL